MEKLPKARNEMDVPKTEEKKLTDEDIVQVLDECFAKVGVMSCKDCKVYSGNGLRGCMKNIGRLTIDLIHRLQAENEQLKCDTYKTSWKSKFLKAKKEIERLTEEGEARESDLKIAWVDMEDSRQKYHKCYREKEELRKQVDELTAFKTEAISMSLYGKGRKDGEELAIKDTAKEILTELLHVRFETMCTVSNYKKSKEDIEIVAKAILTAINDKIKEIAKREGVEVE